LSLAIKGFDAKQNKIKVYFGGKVMFGKGETSET
jgi:hypothetical protein